MKDKKVNAKRIVDELIATGHKITVKGNWIVVAPPTNSHELTMEIMQCLNEITIYVKSLPKE